MADPGNPPIPHWSSNSNPHFSAPEFDDQINSEVAVLWEIISGGKYYAVEMPSRSHDEVVPGIAVSEESTALDLDTLKQEGYTRVINTCEGTGFFHSNTGPEFYAGVAAYFGFPADDSNSYDISKHFDDCNKFLAEAIDVVVANGERQTRVKPGEGKVLVHCKAGSSRSAAVALAFLVANGWSCREAVTQVRSKREICPNKNFLGRLVQYSQQFPGGAA
eukprot:m.144530 g.144530  ORF g.144530 m.144530 type:complete len:219 (-) comp17714_c0_seq2:350-1006(-)